MPLIYQHGGLLPGRRQPRGREWDFEDRVRKPKLSEKA